MRLTSGRRAARPSGDEEVPLKILFYGRLGDAIAPEIELPGVSGCSVGDLRARLVAEHAGAAETLRRSRAVIADSFVSDEHLVADLDRVEFLPPVSGG